jgi:3-deoxy-D-manno-octulosonic acid kinase
MEEAQRRGVPTIKVLGARVEWILGPLYRGLLVTREATGFHNLWNWLHTTSTAAVRRATLSAVAQAIAIMHEAGIAHADLNPANILVCSESNPPQALIIDFDRARLLAGPVPSHLREANLSRFRRFFSKYDGLMERMSRADFEYFRQTYRATLPGSHSGHATKEKKPSTE